MNDDDKNIWQKIDIFRKSSYYNDVIWQRFGAKHAPIKMKGLILESLDEFRGVFIEFLMKYTMIRSKTHEPILSKNLPKEIRDCLARIFNEDLSPKESFEAINNIRGSGIFVSSTILFLRYEGRFIVLSTGVWDGFEELFPFLAERVKKPNNYDSYLEFQNICESIAEVYGFESMAELHEFLWHGHDTDWAF